MFTGETDYKSIEELRAEYGMENFKLAEEEKQKAVELLCEGDIFGLEYLKEIIRERTPDHYISESMLDFVKSVIRLNRMVALGETFGGIHEDFYNEIYELYYNMKMKMLEVLGITNEDWEKYEE